MASYGWVIVNGVLTLAGGNLSFNDTSASINVNGISRFSADATTTSVRSPNGGAYLYINDGLVSVNSADLIMANGGTGYTKFSLPSATAGLLTLQNNAATAGVGLDVATDGTLKLRNRAQTAGTGNLDVGAKITGYNGITTAGFGVPTIVTNGRATAQTAANASIATYTVGAADGTFVVSSNILVTNATNHAFTVQCTYTDEGNTARTVTLPFRLVGDTTALTSSVATANGTVPYLGVPVHIRAKAATAITILTQAAGTYTSVVYNAEGIIRQMS